MWWRFAAFTPATEFSRRFRAALPADLAWQPRYHIASGMPLLTVRRDAAGQWELVPLQWGLVPRLAHIQGQYGRFGVVRADRVQKSKPFHQPLRFQRCLLLAGGFYLCAAPAGAAAPLRPAAEPGAVRLRRAVGPAGRPG